VHRPGRRKRDEGRKRASTSERRRELLERRAVEKMANMEGVTAQTRRSPSGAGRARMGGAGCAFVRSGIARPAPLPEDAGAEDVNSEDRRAPHPATQIVPCPKTAKVFGVPCSGRTPRGSKRPAAPPESRAGDARVDLLFVRHKLQPAESTTTGPAHR
jgi:hypothetical protein